MSLDITGFEVFGPRDTESATGYQPPMSTLCFAEDYPPLLMPRPEALLLGALAKPLGQPRLALQMSRDVPGLEAPLQIYDTFASMRGRLKDSPLEGRLISLGASTIWYGLLDEDSDDARLAFVDSGLAIVEATTGKYEIRKLRKRRAPFNEYKNHIIEPEADRVSYNKTKWGAGAVAVGVTIGAAATFYIRANKNE